MRQCPRCRYGPVINLTCADMLAHDRGRGNGTGRTTNSCPVCEFFSPRWEDWHVWSGADPTVAARCPLCRHACMLACGDVPFLLGCLADADRRLRVASEMQTLFCHLAQDIEHLIFFLERKVGAGGAGQPSRWQHAVPFHRHGTWQHRYMPRHREFRPEHVRLLLAQGDFLTFLWRRLALDTACCRCLPCSAVFQRPSSWLDGKILKNVLEACDANGRGEDETDDGDSTPTSSVRFGQVATTVPRQPDLQSLITKIKEHRRHVALLLHTVRDHLDAETPRKLGQPWRPIGRGEGDDGQHRHHQHMIGGDEDDDGWFDLMLDRERMHQIPHPYRRPPFARRPTGRPQSGAGCFSCLPCSWWRRSSSPRGSWLDRFLHVLPCLPYRYRERIMDRLSSNDSDEEMMTIMRRVLQTADPVRLRTLEAGTAPQNSYIFEMSMLPAQIG